MIETRSLTRRFGSTEAVHELDLRVEAGEIYGFLGPNGAGKTTTIRMLSGLLRPTSGTVHIGGLDLQSQARQVRRLTGVVPDTPPLYDFLTGREYIGFAASLYGITAADRDARSERQRDAKCRERRRQCEQTHRAAMTHQDAQRARRERQHDL